MDMMEIVDRYRDRISARVAERTGGCFDISLDVGDLSVGCVRLGQAKPFMVYRNHLGEAVAMDRMGELVPLPD